MKSFEIDMNACHNTHPCCSHRVLMKIGKLYSITTLDGRMIIDLVIKAGISLTADELNHFAIYCTSDEITHLTRSKL